MSTDMSRRAFLGTASAGMAAAAIGQTGGGTASAGVGPEGTFTKTRVLRVYLGSRPSWPKPDLDIRAEQKRVQAGIDRTPGLDDVEFVGNELVGDPGKLARMLEQHRDIAGVLALPLCLGTSFGFAVLADSDVPTISLAVPYSGHEWCIFPDLQRQGKKLDVIPTSDLSEAATAIRPLRAIHRLRETRVLYVNGHPSAPDAFFADVKKRFGTQIVHTAPEVLIEAYEAVDPADVEAETERWIKQAEQVKEPPREVIADSSRFYLGMRKALADAKAHAITINCLGLFGQRRLPAYPCLGFARLNDIGLTGVCEADLASTITQIIYQHMEGVPGFVTDPVFDLANNAVIHAHCVSATKMAGPAGPQEPYVIRNHLEDYRGASLQVKMRVGQEITLAKLVGDDPRADQKVYMAATPAESLGTTTMLLSTGKIIGVPDTDRGCRTKISTRVRDARKMLEQWRHGLHRVVFYGNHTADTKRLARFLGFNVVEEC